MLTIILISLLLTPFAVLLIKLDYYRRFESVPFLSCKRVGGLTFIRIGRLNISFSVAKRIATQEEKAQRVANRQASREELQYNAAIGRETRTRKMQLLAATRLYRYYGHQPWFLRRNASEEVNRVWS